MAPARIKLDPPTVSLTSLPADGELVQKSIHFISKRTSTGPARTEHLLRVAGDALSSNDKVFAIVFDLDYSWRQKPELATRTVVVRDVGSIQKLNELLLQLLDGTTAPIVPASLVNCGLSAIIISNLSVFYWDMCQDAEFKPQFELLVGLLGALRARYGCCTVTQAFEDEFELGLRATRARGKLNAFFDASDYTRVM